MKKNTSKKLIRNGKAYVGAWISKEVVEEAKRQAKMDARSFASYFEKALKTLNYQNLN